MLKQPVGEPDIYGLDLLCTGNPMHVANTIAPWTTATRATVNRILVGKYINRLLFRIAVSSGNYDIGGYPNNGSNPRGAPGTVITGTPYFTLGSTAMPAAGDVTVTISDVALSKGDFLAMSVDNTTATIAVFADGRGGTAFPGKGQWAFQNVFPLPLTAFGGLTQDGRAMNPYILGWYN